MMKRISKVLTMVTIITTLMTSFSFATDLRSETEQEKNSKYETYQFVNVDGKTMYTDKEGIPNTGVYAYHKPKNKMVYITKKVRSKIYGGDMGDAIMQVANIMSIPLLRTDIK